MKKLLAFALATLLLLSFAGCSQNNPSDTTHDHTHSRPTAESEAIANTSSPTINTEEMLNTDAPASQSTQETTDKTYYTDPAVAVLSDTLERGTTEGNIYTSTTLGLTFEKPSAWAFAVESDLAYYSGIVSDGFGNFADTASKNPAVYDMYAKHKESGATISICYENMLITTGDLLSSQEYAEIIKNAINENPDSSVVAEDRVTLGARTYSKLIVKTASDTENTLRTYYLTQVGNHMATILATTPADSDLDTDSMFR